MGAWIGGLLGGLLYSSIFYLFSEKNPTLGVWVTIAFCAVIVAVLSMIYFDEAIMVGSAIGGAYVFMRVSLSINF